MIDLPADGPLFDDFVVGATIPPLPAVTITDADNVLYRAITGDQWVSPAEGRYVNPGLVMQYAIGATTNATRRVIANLYYRSVRILRSVEVGDTLRTATVVLGLRDASPKDGVQRGKLWLGSRSSTDAGPVVEMERVALVAARSATPLGHADDIPGPCEPTPLADLTDIVPAWTLDGSADSPWAIGDTRVDPLRDHIDSAAALVRLTFNQAAVHRDVTVAGGQRLVYGGHVQAMAQASLTRLVPSLATVVAWDGCDHLRPVHEDDLLEFRHTLLETLPLEIGRLCRYETVGSSVGDGAPVDILRWTPIVWAT